MYVYFIDLVFGCFQFCVEFYWLFTQATLSLVLVLSHYCLVSSSPWVRLIITPPSFVTAFRARVDLRGGVSSPVRTSEVFLVVSLLKRGSFPVAVSSSSAAVGFPVCFPLAPSVCSIHPPCPWTRRWLLDSAVCRFFCVSDELLVAPAARSARVLVSL